MTHSTCTTGRRGISLVYSSLILVALLAITSLAVDFGRVQVAKSQLRAAADSAARYGAAMLPNGAAAAIAATKDAADDNLVESTPVVLKQNEDIELGFWNAATKTFTKLTGNQRANANAVRVIARRTAARGNAIPTVFAQVLGQESVDVQAESIAMLIPPRVVQTDVPATASPYLAGMPDGTVSSLNNPHNSPDYAPRQSPPKVDVPITPGATLTFDNIEGGANNDIRWSERFQPDGNTGWLTWNVDRSGMKGAEHGKSNLYGPINALVGVFLTDDVPTNANAPTALNFATAQQRNFEELKPEIGQVFFIGDGKRDDGVPQRFVAPKGATRFYLANWDGYEWNNNVGLRTTKTTVLGSVVTVK